MQPTVSRLSQQFQQMNITDKSTQPTRELPHLGALREARRQQKNQVPQRTIIASTTKPLVQAPPLATRAISVQTNTLSQQPIATSPSHKRANSSSSGIPNLTQPINYARNPNAHAFKPVQQTTSPTHGFQAPNKNAQLSPSSISSPSPSPLSINSSSSNEFTNTIVIPRRTSASETASKTNTVIFTANNVVNSHSRTASWHIVEPTNAPQTSTVKGPSHMRRSSLGNAPQLPPISQLQRRNSTTTINASLAVPTHTRRPSGDHLSRAADTTTASTGSVDSIGSDFDRRFLPHLIVSKSFAEKDLECTLHSNATAIRGRTQSLSNVKLPKKADEWRQEQRAKIDAELQKRKAKDIQELTDLSNNDPDLSLSEALEQLDAEIERTRQSKYAELEKTLQREVANKQREIQHDGNLALKKLRVETEQQRIKILDARKSTTERQLAYETQMASPTQNDRIRTLEDEVRTLKQRIDVRNKEIAQLKQKQNSVFKLIPPSPRSKK